MNRFILRAAFAAGLVFLALPAAASNVVKTAFCACTSSTQWSWHAQQQALNELPVLVEGVQEIYLANPDTLEVRSYRVSRTQTGGGTGFGDEYWTTDVSPWLGDSEIVDGINAAILAVKGFDASLQGNIRLGDFPVGDQPAPPDIGSAADLVGPADSPAGFNRGALSNWLQQILTHRFSDSVEDAANGNAGDSFLEVMSTAVQLALDFLNQQRAVWVEFGDGTRVLVEISDIMPGINEDGMIDEAILELSVDPTTAQGPGLGMIPQSAGQFPGFAYSGSGVTVLGLANLALRLGVTIQYSGGSGGGCSSETTIECWETPDGEERCRVTPVKSKEELEACTGN